MTRHSYVKKRRWKLRRKKTNQVVLLNSQFLIIEEHTETIYEWNILIDKLPRCIQWWTNKIIWIGGYGLTCLYSIHVKFPSPPSGYNDTILILLMTSIITDAQLHLLKWLASWSKIRGGKRDMIACIWENDKWPQNRTTSVRHLSNNVTFAGGELSLTKELFASIE